MRWINTQEGATGFIREVKAGLRQGRGAALRKGRGRGCRNSDDGWASGGSGLLELETPRGDAFREPSAFILQSQSRPGADLGPGR